MSGGVMKRVLVALAVAAAFASVVACGGGKKQPATPTAGATATAAAAASQRTGIEAVDAVIAAIESGDIGALVALLRYTKVACVATPEGLSVDPPCDGEPEGTLVEAVPMASCEGGYVPAALARDALNGLLTGKPLADADVHGVYRTAGSGFASSFFSRAALEYAVVLVTNVDTGMDTWALLLGGGGIVGVENGCAETPETFIENWRLTDAVLSPAQ
jgi:hypothetical protein